jgi:MarR family transcriptional regulator, organic hydroperoxide resistance regulator
MSDEGTQILTPPENQRLDSAGELGRAFRRATAALRRLRGRETRRPGELSDAQYGLLFGLCEQPELSSGELALAASLSPAAATEMLDGLVAAGLVQRTRSRRDRRVVLISLTERGGALVDERRARFEPLWRAALAEFSDEQLAVAASVLERLAGLFDELASSESESVGAGDQGVTAGHSTAPTGARREPA